jgi:transposase
VAYDERYRKRAVEYRLEGNSIERTAKTFKIGESTLKEWVRRYKEIGEIKNKPLNRTHKKIDPNALELFVEENPDAYLIEMAEAFNCTEAAIRKALKRLNITRKKRPSGTKSKTPKKQQNFKKS